MQKCEELLVKEPEKLKGAWRTLAGCRGVRLELGCGKGKFTAETAAANPGILFVAVEKVPDAMIIAMERAKEAGLKNVLFINGDAARIRDYFGYGEADLIYINFCDPWPSKRHLKRRLTFRAFLEDYKAVLKAGGEIRFKTDNRALFDFSLEEFRMCGFGLSDITYDLHRNGPSETMTDYEEKFFHEGIPICRCRALI